MPPNAKEGASCKGTPLCAIDAAFYNGLVIGYPAALPQSGDR